MTKACRAPGSEASQSLSANKIAPSGNSSTPEARPGKPDAENPPSLPPGLYVTGTPIGHSRDITLRALDTLRAADLIAAEDTRVTAKLLAIYDIRKPLIAYNDHSPDSVRDKILQKISGGAVVAQVSDAGMPLVSDPGYKLVEAALKADVPVDVIPGVSASLTALALSGQPSDRFLFIGFLPAKLGEKTSSLAELKAVRATLIFYEAPGRLAATLRLMAEVLGDRSASVGRELTKLHQDVQRGILTELAGYYEENPPKGEICILVGPPKEAEADWSKVDEALKKALPFMPLKAAADMVAGLTGLSKRDIYSRGQEIKDAG